MLDFELMVTELTDDVMAKKSIKTDRGEVQRAWETLLHAVEAVNALGELDRTVGDVRLDDFLLPTFVKPFVYPKKVAVDSFYDAVDLVVRPQKTDYVYDPAQIRNAAYTITASQKGKPTFEAVQSWRGEVITPSALPEKSFSGRVHFESTLFFPIPLHDVFGKFYGRAWSNEDDFRMFHNWVARSFSLGISSSPKT